MVRGGLLLATYGLGLAVPFLGAAMAFNWFLAGSRRIQRWLPWVQRGAGLVLVALGLLMATGQFAALSAFLADMGQLITLEQT
jgi:cytochrome c-type biogenesis protein